MKKIFTPLALLCLFQTAWGQITLTSSLNYVAGDSYTIQQCGTTSTMPSLAGANVTVDYSSVTATGDPITQAFVDPSTTPYSSSFPGAAVASQSVSSQGNTGYTYYSSGASILELLGIATSQITMFYSNAQTVMTFPLSYNSTYSDNFAADYSTNGVDGHRSGTINVVADAYGNITTPTGTYPYLRLKITQEVFDSLYMFGSLVSTSVQNSVSYNYMNDNIKSPILSYSEISNSQGNSANAYYYVSGGLTGVNEKVSSVTNANLYPNPAQDNVAISFDLQSAEHATVKVYDITGKVAMAPLTQELAQGHHTIPVNVSSLAPGIYSMVVESLDKVGTTIKFIVN
jgi:hypothetical protein